MKLRFSTKRTLSIAVFAWLTCFLASEALAVELKAGVAKVVITPKEVLKTTAGKLDDGTMLSSDGVDHDIYGRVLVLDDGSKKLVIVTCDLSSANMIAPILWKRCQAELGIDRSQVIVVSTHNHQGPMPRWKANFPYLQEAGNKIFEAVQQAVAAEKGPVKVEFGSGYGYWVRSSGSAPVDYEIQVLKVSYKNKPVAVLFNQPTHPHQNSRTKISAGHPGYAVDEIERLVPGVQAMYGDACGGNQFAVPLDGKSKNYTYNDQPQQLGLLEGHKVVEIMKGNLVDVTGPISSSFEVLPLPLNKLYTYEEAKKMLGNAPRDVGYDHDVYRGTNWLRALLRHYEQALPFPTKTTDLYFHPQGFVLEKPIEDLEVQCQIEQVLVARIGSMPLVALQGEVTAPIGARIKDNFRRRMPIMLFAYMGEHECYIPTREIVRQNVYQALVIRTLYASPVGWAPEVEDAMVAGVNKMVDNVMGNASK